MEIAVTFRRMEAIESIRDYAVEKVSKLRKYLDSPMEAHIVLGVEKFRHQADVTLVINGTRIKGAEETEDMYSAIDQVMDKMEIQLKRHISKTRSRRVEGSRGEKASLEEEAEDALASAYEDPIIEVEKLIAKPMDVEEAAMQLSLSPQGFLVFRNARSREINVIYRKGDGNLGLIEPGS